MLRFLIGRQVRLCWGLRCARGCVGAIVFLLQQRVRIDLLSPYAVCCARDFASQVHPESAEDTLQSRSHVLARQRSRWWPPPRADAQGNAVDVLRDWRIRPMSSPIPLLAIFLCWVILEFCVGKLMLSVGVAAVEKARTFTKQIV